MLPMACSTDKEMTLLKCDIPSQAVSLGFLSFSPFLMLFGVRGPPQRDGRALMERTSFEAETEVLLIKPHFYAKFVTSQILILMASMEKKNLHYLKKK